VTHQAIYEADPVQLIKNARLKTSKGKKTGTIEIPVPIQTNHGIREIMLQTSFQGQISESGPNQGKLKLSGSGNGNLGVEFPPGAFCDFQRVIMPSDRTAKRLIERIRTEKGVDTLLEEIIAVAKSALPRLKD